MPVLIKTGPMTREHSAGSTYSFVEAAYRGPVFGRGEPAFVWIDGDGRGGKDSRLYALGVVALEPSYDNPSTKSGKVRVKVTIHDIEPVTPLAHSTDILPHRDDPTDRVMHNLADVICKNSHKKVAVIGYAEAARLRACFIAKD